MPGAPVPQTLLEAIAALAGGGFITTPMPETQPVTPNAASIELGFPPKTMQNELSGGLPPLGQDMNGFLFLISSHTLWVECGQLYTYNNALATAIGGYLAGTVLGMTDGSGMWLNLTNGNTADPDAGGAGWVPLAAYGNTTVPVTGGTVTLTAAQSKYGVIIFTGVLVGNLTVNLPQTKQEWLVINATTGGFTTTVKTTAGGSLGVVVPQGGFAAPTGVYSVGDGNIYPTVAPLGVAIDQNPTPSTLVERTNAGYVLATYLNQNSGLENPTIGAVFVQNSGADGFLRKIGLTNFEAQCLLQGFGGALVNAQVPFSVVSQWASALFSSPAFTGVPTAPTAAPGTATTQVATTAFVNQGQNIVGNGYMKFPSGLILQWGTGPNTGGGGSPVINFNIAFPTQCFVVVSNTDSHPTQSNPVILNASSFQCFTTGGTPRWIALGN